VIVLNSGSPGLVREEWASDARGLSGEGVLHLSAMLESSGAADLKATSLCRQVIRSLPGSRLCLRGFGGHRRDLELVNALPVHLGNLEFPAPPLKLVARGGYPPELGDDKAARRAVLGL